ncbi:MAG: 1,4-alpha-glucan branching protein GlgB [candidate division WOR-3 bacterium]
MFSLFTDYDIYLFKKGCHYKLYEKLGSHVVKLNGKYITYFSVWAPNAERVSVVGDFNNWDPEKNPLFVRWDGSGIWEGIVEKDLTGSLYKYFIVSKYNNYTAYKSDPFGFYFEKPPGNASIVWRWNYKFFDEKWLKERKKFNSLNSPISIYEVHLGSFKRKNGEFLNYREIAHILCDHVKELGFTHVEFLPLMEHPFYGSWGYLITGYFAPTSRYGNPDDLMYLIDHLHKNNIGVFLDWVPSHFSKDDFALSFFDGTHLYEHQDPRKGRHPDWDSLIFNYGRYEVKSFLISSASFWLDKYHADGLRVDAVASMLYLDYSRKEGEWIPNIYGGRENLEAIEFLKELNTYVYKEFEGIQMIAEESTAWPGVSRPCYLGGLGFGMKWNMGWMHDTLFYFSKDPIYRKYHHNQITFSIWYAFSENFILPLSHDEVVYGKGSLLSKMPGDEWQKFANLRLLYGYMFAHPGKKLLFMGSEIGDYDEWNHERELNFSLLKNPLNKGLFEWVKTLNNFYKNEPCLYEIDFEPEGFEWIDFNDYEQSVISFLRKDRSGNFIVIVCNFTPCVRENYRIGVPKEGKYIEVLNSDDIIFGGSGVKNSELFADKIKFHGRDYSISLKLPPLGIIFLKNA